MERKRKEKKKERIGNWVRINKIKIYYSASIDFCIYNSINNYFIVVI